MKVSPRIVLALAVLSMVAGGNSLRGPDPGAGPGRTAEDLDAFLQTQIRDNGLAGVGACIVKGGPVV
jgi:hypothetical protein